MEGDPAWEAVLDRKGRDCVMWNVEWVMMTEMRN